MTILIDREELEKNEKKRLASFAMRNTESQGREFEEEKDKYRLDFQRDRDRILHCKSFRRLKGKTQVFVSHHGDHFRSRLTHTLEVAQISRSLARNLRVNEDLAETIALAHDLGHTPFGHAGEEAMNDMMYRFGMEFEHNAQSRRIVEKLEKKHPDYKGLNLTYETREGLWKHRTPHDKKHHQLSEQAFLEAQIVDLADEIAFQNHDLDDGIRSGVLNLDELEKLVLWRKALERVPVNFSEDYRVSHAVSGLINLMINDVLNEAIKRLESLSPKTPDNIRNHNIKIMSFSDEIDEANHHLRHFLFSKFYKNTIVAEQSKRGGEIIKKLFFYFLDKPEKLPESFIKKITEGEEKEIAIKDFIAGMTDDFAINTLKMIEIE